MDFSGISVILYEVSTSEKISLIAADPYTVFVCKADGSLYYWNNLNIKYHDDRDLMGAEDNGRGVFQGEFMESIGLLLWM